MSVEIQLEDPGRRAPGCYIIRKIVDGEETDTDLLIDIDWNFPAIASAFGWVPCPCRGSDGTVDCCGRTAGEMIAEAQQYIDDHIGERVEDPGYF